jgi:hypothetical protein
MPCHHPIRAWRTDSGDVRLNKEVPDAAPLALPCGGCLGCRTSAAKAWALRCQLELQQHRNAVFTTLTYDPQHEPVTLEKRHLQLWLKRVRKALGTARPIRFFASGEYGEKRGRPHYHALVFGAAQNDAQLLDAAWGMGHTRTERITPARIAYTAGYVNKKIGYKLEAGERVDPETGEVYEWQPPFIQMSRRPGIGGSAREHTQSWRAYAVQNGTKMPVPRFYHEAWKRTATAEMIEQLEYERQQSRATKPTVTRAYLDAAEAIAKSKAALTADRRKL